jgi:hypothetical protein
LNNNKKITSSTLALAFGALLTALPGTAATITFTTGPNAGNFGSGPDNYYFLGDNTGSTGGSLPSFTLNNTVGTFFNASGAGANYSNTFGSITGMAGSPAGSVVNVNVTPTIGGVTATTALDFQGTVAVTGGTPTINFSGSGTQIYVCSTGVCTSTSPGAVQYTEMTSTVNGVAAEYAIQTVQTLDTSSQGKTDWLAGYIVGVPMSTTPEPATLAATGLALMLVGFAARRKQKANS